MTQPEPSGTALRARLRVTPYPGWRIGGTVEILDADVPLMPNPANGHPVRPVAARALVAVTVDGREVWSLPRLLFPDDYAIET